MKITLYELLGLIKDGKAPKKIKFKDNIWELKDGFYYNDDYETYDLLSYIDDTYYLKEITELEVEILEDNKKIEKVNTYVLCDSDFERKGEYSLKATEIIDRAFEEYSKALNEIIDIINKEEK